MKNKVTTCSLEEKRVKNHNGNDTAIIVNTFNDELRICSEFSVFECSNACIVVG